MLADLAAPQSERSVAATKNENDERSLTPVNVAEVKPRDQGGGWFARLLRMGVRPAANQKVAVV
jgi:hypothetical protein